MRMVAQTQEELGGMVHFASHRGLQAFAEKNSLCIRLGYVRVLRYQAGPERVIRPWFARPSVDGRMVVWSWARPCFCGADRRRAEAPRRRTFFSFGGTDSTGETVVMRRDS